MWDSGFGSCTGQKGKPTGIPSEELLEGGKEKVADCTEILIGLIEVELHEHQFPFLHISRSLDDHSMLLRAEGAEKVLGKCPTGSRTFGLPPMSAEASPD